MIRYETKNPHKIVRVSWESYGIYLERAEGCKDRVNGWAVGDPKNPDDAKDAEHLYSVLENSVIPTYYNNRNDWILMMKEAIKTGVDYTAHRMITEYNHKYYRVETISWVPLILLLLQSISSQLLS